MDFFHWIQDNRVTVFILLIISIITFVGTLAAVPFLLIRLPVDYFSYERHRREPGMAGNPIIRIALLIAKNILGYIIITAGVAMLVLPGQGILTILAGLMLIDFPGKFQLERKLISQPSVLRAVNWLRVRAGHPELMVKGLDDLQNGLDAKDSGEQ
ncbi:MAG: hypothetical protein EHM72_16025 [Calditrichaeota bacterium]|nr:MAG: hypothetical protein EHM72_16025 [Calditrichota bacterium]